MPSMMTSFLLPLLVLVAACHCAPGRRGFGWNAGGSSSIDVAAGGQAIIKKDGMSLNTDADGAAGVIVKGEGNTGFYWIKDNEITAGRVAVGGVAGGVLKPGLQAAIGIVDSKGNTPLKFQPALNVQKTVDGGFNGEILTGNDALSHIKKHDFGGFYKDENSEGNSALRIYSH